ncbi:uncharacterized protein [Leptinotarsa decemlineata]|uniref:uncharacterized protein n=1 Tax=Leptinotarsa decemlineata TaxID=7539 RepID=UPI003D305F8F
MVSVSNLSMHVAPPEKFTFSTPALWIQWKKRFQRYISVSGLSSKSDKEKIDILMYVMGEESEEVSLTFATQPTTYEDTLKAFEGYFIPRRNVIFERYKFNPSTQKPGESIDAFITSLHTLAEHCDYDVLKDQLIRDRIVVGMIDTKTSERMQLQANLTLADAIIGAKQSEIQGQQNSILRHEGMIHAVANRLPRKSQSNHQGSASKDYSQPHTSSTAGACENCGLKPHSHQDFLPEIPCAENALLKVIGKKFAE